jgi:hypothetical protein
MLTALTTHLYLQGLGYFVREEFSYDLPPMKLCEEYKAYMNDSPEVRLRGTGSFCSGVVVSSKYILTAAHCVEELKQPLSIEDTSLHYLGIARVVGISDKYDSALLLADLKHLIRPAKVDFTGEFSKSMTVPIITCGWPETQKHLLCTPGMLTGTLFFKRTGKGLLYQGMSGGPTYHALNRVVVGLNSAVTVNSIVVAPIVGLPELFNVRVLHECQ